MTNDSRPRFITAEHMADARPGDLCIEFSWTVGHNLCIYPDTKLNLTSMEGLPNTFPHSYFIHFVPLSVTADHDVEVHFDHWIQGIQGNSSLAFELYPDNPTVKRLCGELPYSRKHCRVIVSFNKRLVNVQLIGGTLHLGPDTPPKPMVEVFELDFFKNTLVGSVTERFARRFAPMSAIRVTMKGGHMLPPIPRLEPGWLVMDRGRDAMEPNVLQLCGPLETRQLQMTRFTTLVEATHTMSLPPPDRSEHMVGNRMEHIWIEGAVERWSYVYIYLRDRAQVFYGILPPYVILWLLDWLPDFQRWGERGKIRCIEETTASMRRIIGARDTSKAAHTPKE